MFSCVTGYPVHLTVLGFETVTVPLGTFKNVMKVRTEAQTLTPDDLPDYCTEPLGRAPDFRTVTEWFAPGVGLIEKVSELPRNDSNGSIETVVETLTDVSGLELPITDGVTPIPVRARDMVYNEFADRIYASVPISKGELLNKIAMINPSTADVESSLFVGHRRCIIYFCT